MQLYDTAQRNIIRFDPPKNVRIYTCGVTPYDSAHLGHILTFLTYDILQRRLEDTGHTVQLVRNITDVDEPIYGRAAELGISYITLAADEIEEFQTVMRQLNFRPASAEPKASEYISQMSLAVEQLKHDGYAYRVDQDWYFDTHKLGSFGAFSRYSPSIAYGLMAERGGDPERPGKKNPLDFLLWKAVKDPSDVAAWPSPLGRGRPGWHIECSVMSEALLGVPFDLHGGGSDLIFPHHECEIAQARGLGHDSVATHWAHVSPLRLYGEKMSKSLGNLVFAKDLLQEFEPSVIRLALMHYHYRTGGEWCSEFLQQSQELLQAVRHKLLSAGPDATTSLLVDIRDRLDDNLDTPEIIYRLRKFVASPATSKPTIDAAATRHMEKLLGLTLTQA